MINIKFSSDIEEQFEKEKEKANEKVFHMFILDLSKGQEPKKGYAICLNTNLWGKSAKDGNYIYNLINMRFDLLDELPEEYEENEHFLFEKRQTELLFETMAELIRNQLTKKKLNQVNYD